VRELEKQLRIAYIEAHGPPDPEGGIPVSIFALKETPHD
jgi:hypothetical protein